MIMQCFAKEFVIFFSRLHLLSEVDEVSSGEELLGKILDKEF